MIWHGLVCHVMACRGVSYAQCYTLLHIAWLLKIPEGPRSREDSGARQRRGKWGASSSNARNHAHMLLHTDEDAHKDTKVHAHASASAPAPVRASARSQGHGRISRAQRPVLWPTPLCRELSSDGRETRPRQRRLRRRGEHGCVRHWGPWRTVCRTNMMIQLYNMCVWLYNETNKENQHTCRTTNVCVCAWSSRLGCIRGRQDETSLGEGVVLRPFRPSLENIYIYIYIYSVEL